jgi:DNA mismatch repair ATPase MutS
MSGKSTFLRTVGVNLVLAWAGAPVCADKMRVSRLQLGATLRIHDSLDRGVSRFYTEILKLKKIEELALKTPTLFLLDEILHGTNSLDRVRGAKAILKTLIHHKAMGLVTTHDLALTEAADGKKTRNAHFEDQWLEGKLFFDYKLREGVITRSNALELLRSVGFAIDDLQKN